MVKTHLSYAGQSVAMVGLTIYIFIGHVFNRNYPVTMEVTGQGA